jgi:hypothetical protein
VSYPAKPPIDAIRAYLERAFPGQVARAWWGSTERMQTFVVAHAGAADHQAAVPAAFLDSCPDCAGALHASEMADYMRETRAERRRFTVIWDDGMVRIRSRPL